MILKYRFNDIKIQVQWYYNTGSMILKFRLNYINNNKYNNAFI